MAIKTNDQDYYKHGYDSHISKTHAWRSVENCSAYMIPFIKPTDKILDVGCGPGSITSDLGSYVPQGTVIGVEPTEEIIEDARTKCAEKGVKNVSFQVGSVYKLPFDDNSFDIVHTHQVIIHLNERVEALKELRRVTKPKGYVCCKEGDMDSMIVYPAEYEDTTREFLSIVGKSKYTSTNCGRKLRELALEAGFRSADIKSTASLWYFGSDDDRKWFSTMYIERMEKAQIDADEDTKKGLIEEFKRWSSDERGVLSMLNGEVVCQKN